MPHSHRYPNSNSSAADGGVRNFAAAYDGADYQMQQPPSFSLNQIFNFPIPLPAALGGGAGRRTAYVEPLASFVDDVFILNSIVPPFPAGGVSGHGFPPPPPDISPQVQTYHTRLSIGYYSATVYGGAVSGHHFPPPPGTMPYHSAAVYGGARRRRPAEGTPSPFPYGYGFEDDPNDDEYLWPPERDDRGRDDRERGLSEEVIARLLKTRIDDQAKTEEDEEICAVCHDDFGGKNEIIGILKCGHEYHASCIKIWLKRKNTCPLCKSIAL